MIISGIFLQNIDSWESIFPVLFSRNMDKLKNIEKLFNFFVNINRVGGAWKLLPFKLLAHFN